MKKHAAPIIAATLLLLSVLYVGSYFALVTPDGGILYKKRYVDGFDAPPWYSLVPTDYRYGGQTSERIFWPLERIDRKIRPWVWESRRLHGGVI